MLTDNRFYGPLERKRHCQVIIHLYLSDSAEYAVSLDSGMKKELCDLLMKDMGVTKLMEACVATTEVFVFICFVIIRILCMCYLAYKSQNFSISRTIFIVVL